MSRNAAFADALLELADYLEANEVDFKPQMYRTAAANIRDYPTGLETLVAEERVSEIEGVGESIAEKAASFLEDGTFDALERERERLPVDMEALTAVEGLGPKRVKALYEALEITDLDDLEAAAEAGDIASVSGFGEKTQQNILDGIDFARQTRERELLGDARPVGETLVETLERSDAVTACDVGGSLRRWKETIGDIDLLVGSADPASVIDVFTGLERAEEVLEAGENKAAIRASGIRVDLRVVVPDEYGAALQYFTGSREHNIRLRNLALDRGYKVNEYGVFDVSDVEDPDAGQRVGVRVAGETETSVYEQLNLDAVPPELREDTGELEAAAEGTLPELLEEGDISGDLHVHTDWSDGSSSIQEMAVAAEDAGHEYIVIADHANGPGVVGSTGLSDAELQEQREAIETAREETSITILAGVEVNIDEQGSLVETSDDQLDTLDCVVASPHSGLNTDEDATDRLIQAVEHDAVDILGHPSGRLLNQRQGLSFDVSTVAEAAARNGTALEVNANPSRLDLWGGAVETVLEAGATVAVNTDAHSRGEYANMRYGVHTARRGWAEADDVLNTKSEDGLREFLH